MNFTRFFDRWVGHQPKIQIQKYLVHLLILFIIGYGTVPVKCLYACNLFHLGSTNFIFNSRPFNKGWIHLIKKTSDKLNIDPRIWVRQPPYCFFSTLTCRVAGAALFGWSRSHFFGPAPAPTLQYLKYFDFTGPKK